MKGSKHHADIRQQLRVAEPVGALMKSPVVLCDECIRYGLPPLPRDIVVHDDVPNAFPICKG
jgi:hypothetical protein